MALYPEFSLTPVGNAFSRGRAGKRVGALVIHSAVGSAAATHSTFAAGRASTHFDIHQDGIGDQFLDTQHTAWATGRRWANQRTISTELEGGPLSNVSESLTEEQYAALVKWVYWGLKAHGLGRPVRGRITGNRLAGHKIAGNLLEHNQIVATACPSGRVPWARLIRDVNLLFNAEEGAVSKDATIYRQAIRLALLGALNGAAVQIAEDKPPTADQLQKMRDILKAHG